MDNTTECLTRTYYNITVNGTFFHESDINSTSDIAFFGRLKNYLGLGLALFVISILGIIANAFSIAAILHIQKGLTPHLKFIVTLAVPDCCIAMSSLVLALNVMPLGWHVASELSVYLLVVSLYVLQPFAVVASVLSLLALGTDLYVGVVKPLHYKRIMINFRANLCSLIIWMVSFIVGLLDLVAAAFADFSDKSDLFLKAFIESYCFRMLTDNFIYSRIIVYILNMSELFILLFLYVRILCEYKKFAARQQAFQVDDLHNKRAMVTILAIIGTFVVGWVPISLIIMKVHFNINVSVEHLFESGYILMTFNALIDTIIFGLRLRSVQQGYTIMFRKVCRWIPTGENPL